LKVKNYSLSTRIFWRETLHFYDDDFSVLQKTFVFSKFKKPIDRGGSCLPTGPPLRLAIMAYYLLKTIATGFAPAVGAKAARATPPGNERLPLSGRLPGD
jgi:hypothetical protein